MRSWLRFIGPSYFAGHGRSDQRALSDHLIAAADQWLAELLARHARGGLQGFFLGFGGDEAASGCGRSSAASRGER
jgi:hypothetical protein